METEPDTSTDSHKSENSLVSWAYLHTDSSQQTEAIRAHVLWL